MNMRSLIPFGSNNPVPVIMNPFGSLQREVDRLFNDFTRGFGVPGMPAINLIPSVDVTETDKEIEITVELPGLERSDVEISLNDDVLTIRGEKKVESKEKDDKKNVHLAERAFGVFYRAIQLPAGVDAGSIQATMSNGVLKITIPRPAPSQAKKIEIRDGYEAKATTKQAA